jgi:glycosyltransferase involved in cell wall biosynthesis
VTRNNERSATPTVSIGMPVYNGERYIREALDSLLAQTYTDFELIISDNASTDGTESACREYATKDARVHYIRQNENRGFASNFRFVLDKAEGNYFMWAACDDFWLPNFISECVSAMASAPSAGFVVVKYRIISRYSLVFSRYFVPDLSFVANEDPKERVLQYSNMPFGSHKDNLVYAFWNKKAIASILCDIEGPLNKVIIGGAMNQYALSRYKGAFVNKTLFFKKYRYTVPGHALNPMVELVLSLFHKRFRKQINKGYLVQDMQHLNDIRIVLQLAGFDQSFIIRIVNAHRSYLDHEIFANIDEGLNR